MEQEPVDEVQLKVDELFKQKEQADVRMWRVRGVLKLMEVIGFMGTFLCTNPIGFTISVIMTAVALAIDFWLQWCEWDRCNNFNKVFH